MQVIQGANNVETMIQMYDAVRRGTMSEARGMKTINVHNLAVVLDAGQPIMTSFNARKLNLNYCKKEWLWYLGANKFDDSIEQHATMWKKLKQADGSYNSNYGQYIFAEPDSGMDSQFWYCINQLIADRGSRRSTMMLLKSEHLYPQNTDTVCTYGINFTIEEGFLHMTVMMRSNDVIFGFTNDVFCFHQLYALVFIILKENLPDIMAGTYTHLANSMHVYERHFDMIDQLIADDILGYYPIDIPRPTATEAIALVRSRGQSVVGDYSTWLHT